jgi:hypothetical protein
MDVIRHYALRVPPGNTDPKRNATGNVALAYILISANFFLKNYFFPQNIIFMFFYEYENNIPQIKHY